MAAGRVDGADRLRSTLSAAAKELDSLADAHHEAGELLLRKAQGDAPRDTGYLAEHHELTVVAGLATVTADAPYAGAVHARVPWLTKDLDALEDDLLGVYKRAVTTVVATVKGD